ncbi:hypothetical protein LguiA_018539 [Lonicera macranthoides]
MAGSDPQKQLFTLIRGFATEKSQGERRIVNLKNQIEELRSKLELANLELEGAKRVKEVTEQELKGYEVELRMNEASIQTLESRTSLIQDEISTVGFDVETLKNEEANSRDEFISKMFEMNAKIRNFYKGIRTTSDDEAGPGHGDTEDGEDAQRDLENKLAHIISQTSMEEQQYEAERKVNRQVQQELSDFERKIFLMEAVVKASLELQELTKYPR